MTLIEWHDEFKTGIPALDYEHREMISLLNRLYIDLAGDGSRENIVAFLGEVYARISAHFALEEAVMRERRYDGLPAHKLDHERLLEDIRELMDTYEGSGDDNDEAFRAEFSRRLKAWFVDHFREQDARLHRLFGA
ncbi:MAG: hemerythrin family protein [Rhodospirillales bacterium]|nr:hemerythrin family protein [Rhodospirillales bacterium]